MNVNYDLKKSIQKLASKIELANEDNLVFSEFGTRRRISAEMQDAVVDYLVHNSDTCVGTSNVHFACKYNIKAIGTYPHEWPMFHAAVTGGYIEANNRAMEDWVKVYDGYLGTALIDAFTTPVFLKNFSKKLACLFDGVRQDSGDEYIIGNMIIARYKAPSIVMKLMMCRLNSKQEWHFCVKISDDHGKEMGNHDDIVMAKYQIGMIKSVVPNKEGQHEVYPEWWYQYNKWQVDTPPSCG